MPHGIFSRSAITLRQHAQMLRHLAGQPTCPRAPSRPSGSPCERVGRQAGSRMSVRVPPVPQGTQGPEAYKTTKIGPTRLVPQLERALCAEGRSGRAFSPRQSPNLRDDVGTAGAWSKRISPPERADFRDDAGTAGAWNMISCSPQRAIFRDDVGAERRSRGILSILTQHSFSYQFFGLFRSSRSFLPARLSSPRVSVWSIAAPPRISYQFCWSDARSHPLPYQILEDSRRGGAMGCWCISDVTQI